MATETCFAQLFNRRANHIKPGLERIRAAFLQLGQPGIKVPHVLVAGTNGKGTTSGFVYEILSSIYPRVGLYTSPHLRNFAERIQVSDSNINDEFLASAWNQIKQELDPKVERELSFFEIATLLSLRVFDESQTLANVFEVGLGGRWDATNITDPAVSIVTNIGRDHEEFLGSDLCGIASEKAGVIRKKRPLILGELNPEAIHEGVGELILKVAADHESPIFRYGHEFMACSEEYIFNLGGQDRQIRLDLPLSIAAGPLFLKHNFSLAVTALIASELVTPIQIKEVFGAWDRRNQRRPNVFNGRFQVRRIQQSDGQPVRLLLDVCHNVHGAEQFAQELAKMRYQELHDEVVRPAFVSILREKKINEILDILRSNLDPIVLFKSEDERTFHESQIAERHRDLLIFDSFDQAWRHAEKHWSKKHQWTACGSVRAVGELIEFLDDRDAEQKYSTHD